MILILNYSASNTIIQNSSRFSMNVYTKRIVEFIMGAWCLAQSLLLSCQGQLQKKLFVLFPFKVISYYRMINGRYRQIQVYCCRYYIECIIILSSTMHYNITIIVVVYIKRVKQYNILIFFIFSLVWDQPSRIPLNGFSAVKLRLGTLYVLFVYIIYSHITA